MNLTIHHHLFIIIYSQNLYIDMHLYLYLMEHQGPHCMVAQGAPFQ